MREQARALLFGQRGVIGTNASAGEKLGDNDFVHVCILAQVERGEMEAKYFDRAHERLQTPGAK